VVSLGGRCTEVITRCSTVTIYKGCLGCVCQSFLAECYNKLPTCDDHPELVDTLQKSIYVDEMTWGADGEEEAYQLYALSKKVFSDGGFNFRMFLTNSPTLHQ